MTPSVEFDAPTLSLSVSHGDVKPSPFDFGDGLNSAVLINEDYPNLASGDNSVAFGNDNTVSGSNSIVGGAHNELKGNHSMMVGRYNRDDTTHSKICAGTGNYIGNYGYNGIVVGGSYSPSGGNIYLTGAANATTYTYASLPTGFDVIEGRLLIIIEDSDPFEVAKVTAIDKANNTITLDRTLSEVALVNKKVAIASPSALLNRQCAVFGQGNQTGRDAQLVCGRLNAIDTDALLVVGDGDDTNGASNAFAVYPNGNISTGESNTLTGSNDVAFGYGNVISGNCEVIAGDNNEVSGNCVVLSGSNNKVLGAVDLVTGAGNYITGSNALVVGQGHRVTGNRSITCGQLSRTDGKYALNDGSINYAGADYSLCIGSSNYVNGGSIVLTGAANATTYTYTSLPADFALIEDRTLAVVKQNSAPYQYAIVTAIDKANNTITLDVTLSETALTNETCGLYAPTAVLNRWSVAIGRGVQTTNEGSLVVGKFNALDADAILMVGNGDNENGASNAFAVHANGDAIVSGSLTIGNTTITEQQLTALLALLN